ncbi:MAG: arsenate reductase ArsC [Candidatus Lokiarchaeota archaeon]|nr:arsenate reductase ArsC [Candidatus Lokiarchaeota archaeon]
MTKNLLFICRENRARSQIAEGIANHYKKDNSKIFSAGFEPAEKIHPMAIEVMKEIGIDISEQKPKDIDKINLDNIDMVITLCDTACPVLPPRTKYEHWGLTDPADFQGNNKEKLQVFREVRDILIKRIKNLILKE